MFSFLKKFAIGYILSTYSSEKSDVSSSSLYDHLIKLFNIYNSYQLLNEYKYYLILTVVFILSLVITFLISNETIVRSSRPLLNITLLIWYIGELIFLSQLMQFFYIKMFRLVSACMYVLIFIYQFYVNSKIIQKKQLLELQIEEVHLKNHELKEEKEEKIIIINNIIVDNQSKVSNQASPKTQLPAIKQRKINKESKKIDKKEKDKETLAMKEVRDRIQIKKKKIVEVKN